MSQKKLTRREFAKAGAAAASAALVVPSALEATTPATMAAIPSYLKGYEKQYAANPRAAALEWFRNARYGLFIHYGLYSLLGRHEWVQLRELIPVAKYAELKGQFTAKNFDADYITDMAAAAGMKYVNLTTRHHDGFCLFRTKESDFNSLNSPAKRDLVGELAKACQRKGIGLFLYYTHGRDWKHPHAANNDRWGGQARPKYDPPDPTYATGEKHNLQLYLDFMTRQVTELLTQYGPVAGIWLDGIAVPANPKTETGAKKEDFRSQELYDHVHRMQPQVLVSYKQTLLGTEDFMTPEHKAVNNPDKKPMEINTSMQALDKGVSWGYYKGARHLTADEVWERLKVAAATPANLLLNTGPLPDGSIDPHDNKVLREVGERVRKEGFPKA